MPYWETLSLSGRSSIFGVAEGLAPSLATAGGVGEGDGAFLASPFCSQPDAPIERTARATRDPHRESFMIVLLR